MKKAHALGVGAEILGDRWARDHADDKKPVLAAALETAFDIQKNDACVSLNQVTRDNAAAWIPPGLAYDGGMSNGASMLSDLNATDNSGADNGEDLDTEVTSVELPRFPTEEAALNGTAA